MDLTELQTAPPALRAGLVTRSEIVAAMLAADPFQTTVVIAPAGYGKTTVLAQFAAARTEPTVWLTLSRTDNDVTTFLSHVATACVRGGLLSATTAKRLRTAGPASLAVAVAGREPNGTSAPPVIILDQTEVLTRGAVLDVLGELIESLQGRVQFVVASRSTPRLPVALLRAGGRILEITEADLSMSEAEAEEMLSHLAIPAEDARGIVGMCEGWPVALYLIALALRQGKGKWSVGDLGGTGRFMVDYLSEQVIRTLPRPQYEFLVRTSILNQLSGHLCDAMLKAKDSERLLRNIEASTHLVQAVDPIGDWYAINGVLRAALRTELDRVWPDAVASMHRRAAAWYESRDLAQPAIDHARMAGDVDRFTRLMVRLMRVRYTTGGAAQVRGWMTWLESTGTIAKYPEIAAIGSLIHLLEGSSLEAERWLEQATAGGAAGAGVHPMVMAVRALSARSGMGALVEDARIARAALEPGSFWLPAVSLIEGLGHMWGGDPRSADALFAEAVTLGESTEAYLTLIVALAERAAIAIGMGQWDRAGDLVRRSLACIEESGLEGYPVSGLSLAVAARVARHHGDLPRAESLLTAAARIRPHLNAAIAGLTVQVSLEMAKAYVEMSDIVGARALIRDASDIVVQRPDLGELPAQLEDLKSALRGVGPGTIGPAALTKAELRLLPLLATHLTFPEIGDRLYISRHTVKTQAMAIYRKLGTSSRSEAVAKALETGMLVQ